MRFRFAAFVMLVSLVGAACSAGGGASDGSQASVTTDPSQTETTVGGGSVPTAESDSAFVRHVQEELNHLGFHAGHVDGVWGQATSDALAAFQTEQGLESSGHYDPATADALSEAAVDADALSVEALQQKLDELGFYQDLIDGGYGPATETAVEAYQEARGLEVTGTMTHETVLAIADEHAEKVEAEHLESAKDLGIGGADKVATTEPDTGDATLLRQGSDGSEVQDLQEKLTALGYRPGTPDGRFGAATASAVLAFEKAEGLDRDGVAGPEVIARLDSPHAAGPKRTAGGPHVEVDLDRQIMFIIDGSGDVTTVNVSTGSGRAYTAPGGQEAVAYTPDGDFNFDRSFDGLRKAPLGTLYRPIYFKEGWAIHGNSKVPPYPASHGCVRTANWDQDFLWTVVSEGDAVSIYGHNPGDASAGHPGA